MYVYTVKELILNYIIQWSTRSQLPDSAGDHVSGMSEGVSHPCPSSSVPCYVFATDTGCSTGGGDGLAQQPV